MSNGRICYIAADVLKELDQVVPDFEDRRINSVLRVLLGLPQVSRKKPPRHRGYKFKYDVSDLNVGDSKTVAWRLTKKGKPAENQYPIIISIRRYMEVSDREFEWYGTSEGLKVWRTK